MLKDIPNPAVENIVIAIIRESDDQEEPIWNVYIVNLYNVKIENVLVSSTGYGTLEGREVKTTVLRHMIGDIDPNDYAKIEAIMKDVFGLTNEYWVSFYINKQIYDKKYVFLPESIMEENFTMIPMLNKLGVMIR